MDKTQKCRHCGKFYFIVESNDKCPHCGKEQSKVNWQGFDFMNDVFEQNGTKWN